MDMTKYVVLLVLTWCSTHRILASGLSSTVISDASSTTTTPMLPAIETDLDLDMKITIMSVTPNSIEVEWNPPSKDKGVSCRLLTRERGSNRHKAKKMTIIFDLSNDERMVLIPGLHPDTLYMITLECTGKDDRVLGRAKYMTTLRQVDSRSERERAFSTPAASTSTPAASEKLPLTTTTTTEVNAPTMTSDNSSRDPTLPTGQKLNAGDSSNQRLIWLIPTVVGSVALLMVMVAIAVACSRAMVKRKRHGNFKVNRSHNESGKRLIHKSEKPDNTAGIDNQGDNEDMETKLEGKLVGEPQPNPALESNSVNTLQVRQPPHLTTGNRGAVSGISWGSEFDVLDRPETIYTNESHTLTTPPPYQASPEPFQQSPPAFFHQNSVKSAGGSAQSHGGYWGASLPPGHSGHLMSTERPVYSDPSSFDMVIPAASKASEGCGVYSNVQVEESLYVNTGSDAGDLPPVIPPRPR